jgi:hypothetical protein
MGEKQKITFKFQRHLFVQTTIEDCKENHHSEEFGWEMSKQNKRTIFNAPAARRSESKPGLCNHRL